MFATGLAVYLGLMFIFLKLKRRRLLQLLRHDLWLDLAVTLVTLAIHWGSFSGVMAATLAGLLTSVTTSLAKQLVGYIDHGLYHPGYFRLSL